MERPLASSPELVVLSSEERVSDKNMISIYCDSALDTIGYLLDSGAENLIHFSTESVSTSVSELEASVDSPHFDEFDSWRLVLSPDDDNRMVTPVKIQTSFTRALVDSGASLSIVQAEWHRDKGVQFREIPKQTLLGFGYGSRSCAGNWHSHV